MDSEAELAVRVAAMAWLDARPTAQVDINYLSNFEFDGERISLVNVQGGIRKPRQLTAALSVRTGYTRQGDAPPYSDDIGDDGLQRYKYRGVDPQQADNRALRRAYELKLPIIWLVAVLPGQYEPIYPVWVIDDDPHKLEFTLALDGAQRWMKPADLDEDARRYALRLTKQRLHQRMFRANVIMAYRGRCCICRIAHAELLDAAHIIEDGLPNGDAITPNGLAMCKIHHAAFDAGILGVRPDLTLHVRKDVLDEVDGWMLKGGIQGVHNHRLEIVPRSRADKPDPIRLEVRYDTFLQAG